MLKNKGFIIKNRNYSSLYQFWCNIFVTCRTEQRLHQLQRNLGEAEEDKKGIDGRLASAQTALMLQEETIRRNERERKSMADKISALERQVVAGESEKRQMNVSMKSVVKLINFLKHVFITETWNLLKSSGFDNISTLLQEKLAKQKANEARLEEDKKNLRLNLDDAENRVTRGELARRSLEGELQRLKLALNDKETENQVCNWIIIYCSCLHMSRHVI